jgi:hypothetical protein
MALTQTGTTMTGSIFSGIANVIDQGNYDGASFRYSVIYPGRTDVQDSCMLGVVLDAMPGSCVAAYTTGGGAYIISARRTSVQAMQAGLQPARPGAL